MRAQVVRARFLEDELKDKTNQNQHDVQTLKSQVLALKASAAKDADTIAGLRQQLTEKDTAMQSKDKTAEEMGLQIEALQEEIDRLNIQLDVEVFAFMLHPCITSMLP